ncbi:MAG: inositol-3-phosphate synthase [Planctomycetes bacterium]|nr:inositol-3-phosphate synthase [Planctomycetota bacterium]
MSPRSKKTPPSSLQRRAKRRLGVWLVGARGGLATTVMTGARAMAKGLAPRIGLLTEHEMFAGFPLAGFDELVFGGHDIREQTTREAALEVGRDSGSIAPELVRRLAADFRAIDRRVVTGSAPNAGKVITQMATTKVQRDRRTLRSTITKLRKDIEAFRERERCDRVIVVNLSSTEARIRLGTAHEDLAALDRAIDADQRTKIRPSLLYAYAAATAGCPFIHFTPSNVTLCPAMRELFDVHGVPYMGADGKTGETLVKSALAPMFKYRNLRVLSWLGYNLLGDRDGLVLQEGDNKASKIDTKDSLLPNILGYAPQTHVAIDYVASLGDRKTAWDYIHFEGFLGHRMHMEFTWHGCDAILAAPLVLDMVRLVDLATSRGETGALTWLGCFFKSPIGVATQDLHQQWHALEAWVRGQR